MLPKLALGKLTSSWMLIVVVFNLSVAIKTEGNAVLEAVVSPFLATGSMSYPITRAQQRSA
jgi:hypothetical protein